MRANKLIDMVLEGHNINNIISYFVEEISPEEIDKIKNLKRNDKLIVYHGTRSLEDVQKMINGIDATKLYSRLYNVPDHAGLFVTSDMDVASRFATVGGYILKMNINVKNLHGTDFGGVIGRKHPSGISLDKDKDLKSDYPKSFRPYLSTRMLQGGREAQGLYIGFIPPKQIISIYDKSDKKWYSKEEFIKKYTKVNYYGYDLTSTKYSIEEYFNILSKIFNNPLDEIKDMVKNAVMDTKALFGESSKRNFIKTLNRFGFGEKAINSLLDKAKKYFNIK